MRNITFYKLIELEDPKQFRANLLAKCNELNLKGKILLAKEGMNGSLCGEETDLQQWSAWIKTDKRFSDLDIKPAYSEGTDFKRMLVKIKDEVITSHFGNLKGYETAYVTPKELKAMYAQDEDFVIIDTRNTYEHEVGKFKNAITLDLDIFSNFTDHLADLEQYKDKKIITYCTGGIRCEKAAPLLKKHGFSDVYQLKGGIIQYGLDEGDTYWEGLCTVFDKRGAIEIDPSKQDKTYEQCCLCFTPSKADLVCKRCKVSFNACAACVEILEGCCSKYCRNEQRKMRACNAEKIKA